MTIKYVDSSYDPNVHGLQILPNVNYLGPIYQANKNKLIQHEGKTYKLLNVYQRTFNFGERILFIATAIKDLFLAIFFLSSSRWNAVKKYCDHAIEGRQIAIIYKETSPHSPTGIPTPVPTPAPIPTPAPTPTPSSVSDTPPGKKPVDNPIPKPTPSSIPDVPGKKPSEAPPPIPTPPSPNTSVFLSERLKDLIVSRKISQESGEVEVNQITVLEQDSSPDFTYECGYHAFKNFVTMLGFITGNLTNTDIFADVDFYAAWEFYIRSFKPKPDSLEDREATIMNINDAWEHLISDKPLPITLSAEHRATIESVRQFCRNNKHCLSVFSYTGNNAGYVGGSGPAVVAQNNKEAIENFAQGKVSIGWVDNDAVSHPYLDNFQRTQNLLQQADKAFHHIFIMSTNRGHWCTVVLERHPTGDVKWYGLDSYRVNQGIDFPVHLAALERGLRNEKFASVAFNITKPAKKSS